MLDVEEYERLVERAELLDGVATAGEQLGRGEGIPNEEAKARIRARLAG